MPKMQTKSVSEEKGPRDLFCWCWVNVFKIVVKFIGYENLMICKVADKRGAPLATQANNRSPSPSREQSAKGFSAFIQILIFAFFSSPHSCDWDCDCVTVKLMKTLLAKVFPSMLREKEYILGTLPLSFAHKCLCTKFGGSKVFSVPMAKQNCIKVLLWKSFFFCQWVSVETLPDVASVFRLYYASHSSEHTLRMYCVNLCLFEIYIFALKRNLCEVSSERRH